MGSFPVLIFNWCLWGGKRDRCCLLHHNSFGLAAIRKSNLQHISYSRIFFCEFILVSIYGSPSHVCKYAMSYPVDGHFVLHLWLFRNMVWRTVIQYCNGVGVAVLRVNGPSRQGFACTSGIPLDLWSLFRLPTHMDITVVLLSF